MKKSERSFGLGENARIEKKFRALAARPTRRRCPIRILFVAIGIATTVVALAADLPTESLCVQPSPEEIAKAVGVTLPKLPWHVVNIWWDFERPTAHFESLAVDVTIDRDVPESYNLYLPQQDRPRRA